MSWCRAHVFDQSRFPSLLCTPSMRTARLIISCRRDQVYLPVPGTTDEYYRYDLEFDGAHYLWPTDCCGGQDITPVRVRITETVVPQRMDGPEWVIPEEVSLVQEQLEEIEAATPSRFKSGSPAHTHSWDQVPVGTPGRGGRR